MKTIILPQNNKIKKKVDGTLFEGSSAFNIFAMYYLSHLKSNNVCVIYGEPYKPDDTKSFNEHVHDDSCVKLPKHGLSRIPRNQTDVSLRWIENGEYISVPEPQDKFWKNFLENWVPISKKDFNM